MRTTIELDKSELLVWTILQNFEALALKQFELYEPVLAGAEKKALVDLLSAQAPSDEVIETTTLSAPLKNLIEGAAGSDEKHTLLVQGLILDLLGQTIYQTFAQNESVSSATHELCVAGLSSCQATRTAVPNLLFDKVGQGDVLFQAFLLVGTPILRQLNGLGEALDQEFSSRFGISYADLMGEFVAELIPACAELGIDRRKLVGFLTAALMETLC